MFYSLSIIFYSAKIILCLITNNFDIEDEENILLKFGHDTTTSFFPKSKDCKYYCKYALIDTSNELA